MSRLRFILSVLAMMMELAALCPPVHAQSQSDLFQKVFGARKKQQDQRFDAPVRFLVYDLGTVPVRVKAGTGAVFADKATLSNLLERVLTEKTLSAFQALPDADGEIDIKAIAATGVTVTYDAAQLALSLSVPWDSQNLMDISIRPPAIRYSGDLVEPDGFSAYANLRGAMEFDSVVGGTRTERTDTYGATLDSALHFAKTTVLIEADYASERATPIALTGLQLIQDDVDKRLSARVGDIRSRTQGFQASERIIGFGVGRDFDLQPDRPQRPRGRRILELERPTDVEVVANGRPVETIRLPPGRYRLTDLPLSVGTNDYTLILTDDVGRRDIVRFNLFYDTELLGQGETDFDVSAGLPAEASGGYVDADPDDLTVSAFYRTGVTDDWTLGGTLQTDAHAVNFGIQTTHAGVFGNVSLIAESSRASGQRGASLTAQFTQPEFLRWPSALYTDLSVQLTYTGPDYTPFGSIPAENEDLVESVIRIDQALPGQWALSVTGQKALGRTVEADTTRLEGSLRKIVRRRASFDLSLALTQTPEKDTVTAGLGLTVLFGGGTVQFGANTDEDTLQASWSSRPRRPIDTFSAALTAGRSSSGETATATVNWTGQRFDAGLRQTGRWDRAPSETASYASALNAGVALVHAGGTTAVSRPVQDSFAIIRRHPNLSNTDILINPTPAGYLAKTDGLGPLVVPTLGSYVTRQLRLDAPDLEIGQDLGRERPWVKPARNSGVLLTAGTGATVILRATLLDTNGEPHGLQAGHIRQTGGKDPAKSFFTNRKGRLTLDGLTSGSYEITLQRTDGPRAVLEIPEDATGLYDAGSVRLEAR